MKHLGLQFSMILLAGLAPGLTGAPAESPVELKGIMHWAGKSSAVLHIPSPTGRPPLCQILNEHERIGGLEVVKIDAQSGKVILRQAGGETELTLSRDPAGMDTASGQPPRTLDLRAIPLAQVLQIYQTLAGRTILRSPKLGSFSLSVRTGPTLPAETLKVLDQSLANSGVVLKPHGTKFSVAVPARQESVLAKLPAPPPSSAEAAPPAAPTDVIKFLDADLLHVLEIYQELTGRTVLRPLLPEIKLTFANQTELTRREAIHAFDVMLTLSELAVVPEGDKFVFIVPSRDAERLPAISTLRPLPVSSEEPALAKEEPLAAGTLSFRNAEVSQVLAVYAALKGLPPAKSPNTPAARLSFRNQAALTRREALYALDALAAINNLKFAVVDNAVGILPAALDPKSPRNGGPINPHSP